MENLIVRPPETQNCLLFKCAIQRQMNRGVRAALKRVPPSENVDRKKEWIFHEPCILIDKLGQFKGEFQTSLNYFRLEHRVVIFCGLGNYLHDLGSDEKPNITHVGL